MQILQKILRKLYENFSELLRIFYKIYKKKETKLLVNLKKVLQKFYESFAEISKKFCRNFGKFLLETMWNFVVI